MIIPLVRITRQGQTGFFSLPSNLWYQSDPRCEPRMSDGATPGRTAYHCASNHTLILLIQTRLNTTRTRTYARIVFAWFVRSRLIPCSDQPARCVVASSRDCPGRLIHFGEGRHPLPKPGTERSSHELGRARISSRHCHTMRPVVACPQARLALPRPAGRHPGSGVRLKMYAHRGQDGRRESVRPCGTPACRAHHTTGGKCRLYLLAPGRAPTGPQK